MNFSTIEMRHFVNEGLQLAYFDVGARDAVPIVLVHGFGSTAHVNWVHPGWVKTLTDAGYRVIALDNRGHGESAKPYDADVYTPPRMASDVLALMDRLKVERAHLMGYSMGARVVTFAMMEASRHVRSAILGGLGMGMVEGVGDWDTIADALLADDPVTIADARGRMFRAFADQTKSDRRALAACIMTSRRLVTPEEIAAIDVPVLIAVGTKDDIAGSGEQLAALFPNARAVDIPNRDHMLAVGDKAFKAAALDFLGKVER